MQPSDVNEQELRPWAKRHGNVRCSRIAPWRIPADMLFKQCSKSSSSSAPNASFRNTKDMSSTMKEALSSGECVRGVASKTLFSRLIMTKAFVWRSFQGHVKRSFPGHVERSFKVHLQRSFQEHAEQRGRRAIKRVRLRGGCSRRPTGATGRR
eukprot:6184493-Pleurochrysis_carterae.AAC.3